MPDPAASAHEYVRNGLRVVPLHGIHEDGTCRCRAGRTCPYKSAGKHPSLGTAWQERALGSGADVQAWWDDHPHDNVGILTGPESGIFVLDVDGAAGVRSISALIGDHNDVTLAHTRIVQTGSGGFHYYFRHPEEFVVQNSTSWLAPGIDIRGKGGQVVAPPSISRRGPYLVKNEAVALNAPEWLLTMLAEHGTHVAHGAAAPIAHAERVDAEMLPPAIDELRFKIVGIDQGRHKHFHALVAACRAHEYTQGQTVTIVAPWCAEVGKFGGRVEQEVARSWSKLTEVQAREEDWLPGLGTKAAVPVLQLVPPRPAEGDSEAPTADDDPADAELTPSWAPVDLTEILAGTYKPETASLFPREDGIGLVYPGRVHSFHGESESGKSLLVQWEVVRLLKAGRRVAYLDFESDAQAVVGRLLDLGATPKQIAAGFEYRRPDVNPRDFAHEREEFLKLAGQEWALIAFDGATDALGVMGAGSLDNDEIAAFMRRFPRYLAVRTGAAVILVDHVTKNTETRGRYALGGQAKMNALDGAAYTIAIESPIGRGMFGVLVMRVAKDRPGGVRRYGAPAGADRTQVIARVTVNSTDADELIRIHVTCPDMDAVPVVEPTRAERSREARKVALAKWISENGPASLTAIRKPRTKGGVGGNHDEVRGHLDELVAAGFVAEVAGKYAHVRVYPEAPVPTVPGPSPVLWDQGRLGGPTVPPFVEEGTDAVGRGRTPIGPFSDEGYE